MTGIYIGISLDEITKKTAWVFKRILECLTFILVALYVSILIIFIVNDNFTGNNFYRIWCIIYFSICPLVVYLLIVFYFRLSKSQKIVAPPSAFSYVFRPQSVSMESIVDLANINHNWIPSLVTLHIFDTTVENFKIKSIDTTVEIVHNEGSIILHNLRQEERSTQDKIALQLASYLQVSCDIDKIPRVGDFCANSN